MHPWEPEVTVDAGLARALIDSQFPDLAGARVHPFDAGWDNTVFRVGEDLVFRFPRREIAVPGVRREIAVLPRLAARVSLPVPTPLHVGTPALGFPWPWFGARYLPGGGLMTTGSPLEARSRIGTALGSFLRELHSPTLAAETGGSLTTDPMRRADMPHRVAMTRTRLAELAEAGILEDDADTHALLDDAATLPPSSRRAVLHGDLHAAHVLVADGAVTGVIDWGDVCMGDPAIDLSIAFGALAGPARAAFLATHGPLDAATELRARAVAVNLAATLLAYAIDRGLPHVEAECRRALDAAVS
jgi:aminoglycoside phosphotransferase (APT) family kinase protein